jgi:hypothetical protein
MPANEESLRLDRGIVVKTLGSALEGQPFIHAFWEGGAAASGTLDEWSDLDLYLLVDDDKVDETFSTFERTLSDISPITVKLPIPQTGWKGVFQAFYRLARMSEYHIIDLAVVTLSAEEKFLEPTVHGEAHFIFNKRGRIEYDAYDDRAAGEERAKRRRLMKDRLDMFGSFFQKEVNRGNTIEAVDLYHRLFLPTLVELLRMKHHPAHHAFGTRHVHAELPEAIVKRLVRLHLVRDEDDLVAKQDEVKGWIADLLSESG